MSFPWMLTGVVGGTLKVHDHLLCLAAVELESVGLTTFKKTEVTF